MKIEIEYEDVERIRQELAFAQQEIQRLNKELDKRSDENVKRCATSLAGHMFDAAFTAIAKDLGMDYNGFGRGVEFSRIGEFDELEYQIVNPYKATVSATVSNEYRGLFVSLGFDHNKLKIC
jgi:hypothetical protein